jgi:hypothetical protein
MRVKRYLTYAVAGLGGIYILLFAGIAVLRLLYPYEVEWNEGAVLDHAIRILDGKPIYAAPSIEFAAFIYTPVYYYLTALIMKVLGISMLGGRLISLISTIITALLIGHISQKETRSPLLGFSSAALYIAFYRETGYFYDIVRMDALALLFAIAALYSVLYFRRGYVWAAIFIALAYFTKQQMLCFWPAFAGWLWIRNRIHALYFVAISCAILIGGFLFFNVNSHGWFAFYTWRLPSAKTHLYFSIPTAISFLYVKMLGPFIVTTFIIIASYFLDPLSKNKSGSSLVLLTWCYIAAVLASAISVGNAGWYSNVLMPLAAIVAILFPIALERIARTLHLSKSYILLILVFQFLALGYNPLGETMLIASPRQRHAGDEFIAKLRAMPGEVWLPMHGYLNRLAGKPTYIHFMALNDALSAQDSASAVLQRQVDSAYGYHRFSAIIVDQDHSFPPDSIPHYTMSGKIFQTPNVFLSRLGDEGTRPQYLYLPVP